tara:strand:+ start:35 stop:214 length:180 start_codon:yes stop_codon:yes gene_type:complete
MKEIIIFIVFSLILSIFGHWFIAVIADDMSIWELYGLIAFNTMLYKQSVDIASKMRANQ